MTPMDNELTTLSQHVCTLNLALHEYAFSPRRGLEQLYSGLIDFQVVTQSPMYHDTFHQQLVSFIDAVDELLTSGAVYSKDHQLAFLEASDALLQFAIGSQCEGERSLQMLTLLSSERSCWRVLQRILAEPFCANYVAYDARWIGNGERYHEVESYLTQFSGVGEVSFRVDGVNDAKFTGPFSLSSAQSLAWLRQRFPMFRWELGAKTHDDESLKRLFELIYLLFFQQTVLGRQSRQHFLGIMEQQARSLFYRRFASLFPADRVKDLDDAERSIPFVLNTSLLTYDRSEIAFPIRYGGFFYVAVGRYDKQQQVISQCRYLHRLERDIVSSFLYVADTRFGCFAFDQAECFGAYQVDENDFLSLGRATYFVEPSGVMAELVLGSSVFTAKNEPSSYLLRDVSHVLVIKQGGNYYALPYFSISEIEGICAVARSTSCLIKNVWMRVSGEPLLEPWLKPLPRAVSAEPFLLPLKNKNTTSSKNGYYLGEVDGVRFWIESVLVADFLPYSEHYDYTSLEQGEVSCHSFMLHDGLCFFQTLPIPFNNGQNGASVVASKFSIVFEAMGHSIVLNLMSCDWHERLPNADYVSDFGPHQDDNKMSVFTSLRGREVLINNENYLSFVALFNPLSSLAGK